MPPKKRKPGRPKKPAAMKRASDVRIPVTQEEKELMQQAAQLRSERGELADWARTLLLDAAKRAIKGRDS
jgi:hypothetical protein